MTAAVVLVLYLIGFVIYFFKREFILFYYVTWSVFAPYVASFLTFDYDVSLFVDGQANYFLALIYMFNGVRFRTFFVSKKATSLAVAIGFLLLLAVAVNQVPIGFYISWFISNILPIYFAVSILRTINITSKQLTSFLVVLILIQIIVGTCQYYSGLFVNPAYALKDGALLYDNIFRGTFRGENNCMAFISVGLLVYLAGFRNGGLFSKVFPLIFIPIVFFAILISGVRTYLILAIVFGSVFFYMGSKRKATTLIGLVVALFIGSTYLIVEDYSSGRSGDTNAIERQINGLSQIANNDTEGSTLDFSVYMLEEHYNPLHLLGEGKLHTKRGYGRISMGTDTEASVSDATLAVFLVEFGPILLLLFLYYYYQLSCKFFGVKRLKKYIYSVLIFCFYIIAAITDTGIFDPIVLSILSIFSSINKREHLNSDSVVFSK